VNISPGPSTAGLELSQSEAPGQVLENQSPCGSGVVGHSFVACGHYVRRTWSEVHLWSNNLSWRNSLYSHGVSEVQGSFALRKQTGKKKKSVIQNHGKTIGDK